MTLKKLRAHFYPIYRLWIEYKSHNSKLIDIMNHYNDFFFQDLEVDKSEAFALHQEIMALVSLPTAPDESMHRVLFAALKLSGWQPKTILELGTFMGETTAYLTRLFPDAHVYTVDIPSDDPIYETMHPEGATVNQALIKERLNNRNVSIVRINTLWLMEQDMPDFDLIWLDAGHEYPEVGWDHFFCLQKLKPNGWLFTDDLKLTQSNGKLLLDPKNTDINHVIHYVNQRLQIPFQWVLKRESAADFLFRPKGIGFVHARPEPSTNKTRLG